MVTSQVGVCSGPRETDCRGYRSSSGGVHEADAGVVCMSIRLRTGVRGRCGRQLSTARAAVYGSTHVWHETKDTHVVSKDTGTVFIATQVVPKLDAAR